MANVFTQSSQYGGSMKAANVQLIDQPGEGELGTALLVQNVGVQYTQTVNRIYDLSNTNYTYFIAGKTEGNFNMAHIIGPRGMLTDFVNKYGNVCSPGTLQLKVTGNNTGGCESASGGATLSSAILVQIGIGMSADNFMVTETLAGMFVGLALS